MDFSAKRMDNTEQKILDEKNLYFDISQQKINLFGDSLLGMSCDRTIPDMTSQ